jgi:hypothetical protein
VPHIRSPAIVVPFDPGDIVSWGPWRANVYPPPTIVIKLDSNGTPIWWRILASAFGTASALAFDAAGDIYLTGSANSGASTAPGELSVERKPGGIDIPVIRNPALPRTGQHRIGGSVPFFMYTTKPLR